MKTFPGLKSKRKIISIQYIISTNKYQDFKIFFQPEYFSAWYVWIFPHRNYISVGRGADPKHISPKKFKENTKLFPWIPNYNRIRFNNVFLISDAAGLIFPFTGERIDQAFISGEETAKLFSTHRIFPIKCRLSFISTNNTSS